MRFIATRLKSTPTMLLTSSTSTQSRFLLGLRTGFLRKAVTL
uniref:GSVIVT00033188001, NIN1 n=1 Tax=Arundo donax TaxID=35708 RepID=A0A0A9FAB1_ARUDO